MKKVGISKIDSQELQGTNRVDTVKPSPKFKAGKYSASVNSRSMMHNLELIAVQNTQAKKLLEAHK